VIALRLAEPHEQRPVLCGARRGPRGTVRCTRSALHCRRGFHSGRGRRGQWYFWGFHSY